MATAGIAAGGSFGPGVIVKMTGILRGRGARAGVERQLEERLLSGAHLVHLRRRLGVAQLARVDRPAHARIGLDGRRVGGDARELERPRAGVEEAGEGAELDGDERERIRRRSALGGDVDGQALLLPVGREVAGRDAVQEPVAVPEDQRERGRRGRARETEAGDGVLGHLDARPRLDGQLPRFTGELERGELGPLGREGLRQLGEGRLGEVRPDLDDLGCPGHVHGKERGRLGRRGDVERALDDGERRLDAVDVAVGAGKVQRRDGAGELVRSDADVRSGFVLGPILLGAEPRASVRRGEEPDGERQRQEDDDARVARRAARDLPRAQRGDEPARGRRSPPRQRAHGRHDAQGEERACQQPQRRRGHEQRVDPQAPADRLDHRPLVAPQLPVRERRERDQHDVEPGAPDDPCGPRDGPAPARPRSRLRSGAPAARARPRTGFRRRPQARTRSGRRAARAPARCRRAAPRGSWLSATGRPATAPREPKGRRAGRPPGAQAARPRPRSHRASAGSPTRRCGARRGGPRGRGAPRRQARRAGRTARARPTARRAATGRRARARRPVRSAPPTPRRARLRRAACPRARRAAPAGRRGRPGRSPPCRAPRASAPRRRRRPASRRPRSRRRAARRS